MAIPAAAAYRTISTEAMLIIGDMLPIEEKIVEAGGRWRARDAGELVTEEDIIGIERRDDTTYDDPRRSKGISFDRVGIDFYADKMIYTDGSKTEDGTGAAYVVYEAGRESHSEKYRLANHCTVFQSETLAINKAVDHVARSGTGDWHIISDSRTALLALRGMRKPTELMTDTLRTVRQTHANIYFHWTKGHADNDRNDRADQLAREAVTDGYMAYERAPFSYAKRRIREQRRDNWDRKWTASDKGRLTYQFIRTSRERQEIRTDISYQLTQLLTGHGNFRTYLKRIGKTQDDTCVCGEAPETSEHIMFECRNSTAQRDRAHANLVMTGLGWPANIEGVGQLRRETKFWMELKTFAESLPSLQLDR